jgi:hypothetical protein
VLHVLTSAAGRTIIYSYGATTVRPATFLPLVGGIVVGGADTRSAGGASL